RARWRSRGMGPAERARPSSPCPCAEVMFTALRLAIVAIVLTLTYHVGLARGQAMSPELTIDEIVARAVADNPELRAARADVDAAVGRLQQAGLRPNPELDLGGQKALSPDNNLTVALRLPLDLNDRKGGRVAVAEQD